MARRKDLLVLGLSTVASTLGCTNLYPLAARAPRTYFALEYRVQAEAEPRRVTDVRQAEKFPTVRATWTKGVVRAPETCGSTKDDDGASCAFWLNELERGLVDAKLTVASWSTLHDAERTKNEPAHVAARDLGADVVFVVNRAAVETVALGAKPRESFEVFAIDEDGRTGGRLALADAELEASKAFVKSHVDAAKELANVPSHLTATLDVTAVDTQTGEAVWFYRKREVAALPLRLGRRFAFAREDGQTWPVQPRGLPAADEAARGRELDGARARALADDSQALSRAVVADFLSRLRGG